MLVAALLATMAVLVAVSLEAERRGAAAAHLVAKVAASAAFVAIGVVARADPWVVAALVLSLVGDGLLVPADVRAFRGAIAAFLLAHVAYVVAFAARGLDATWLAAAAVPLAAAGVLVARAVWPGVAPRLRAPVVAYVVVITAMVAAAAGAVGAGAHAGVLLAALAFWGNDVLVARHRFVRRHMANRFVGVPFYYAAQAAFALLLPAAGP